MDNIIPITSDQRVTELEQEIAHLRATSASEKKIAQEWAILTELFPDICKDSIPDTVLKETEEGLPIYAAYAVFARRAELKTLEAQAARTVNTAKSTGALIHDGGCDGNFSLEEISTMSAVDIKKNYVQIIKSLAIGKRKDF